MDRHEMNLICKSDLAAFKSQDIRRELRDGKTVFFPGSEENLEDSGGASPPPKAAPVSLPFPRRELCE
jgi:hypothetical protein